jgi:metallophosphoesterase (TIGR00282 family)
MESTVNILFIGDVVGEPGRRAIAAHIDRLRDEGKVDFCIANAENSAGGFGLTREVADQLFALGVDVLTGGNHIWDKREILEFIDREPRILRPANYPPGVPGARSGVFTSRTGNRVAVLSLMGRVFMPTIDCPFRGADELVPGLRAETPIIVVDVHAEATSEKVAMGWYLDGRVSAVVGTHSHVQTADERILPRGTAYLTDAGMTGPYDSVIGVEKDMAIQRFLTQTPRRFATATGDPRLSGAVITVDDKSGRATAIERVHCSAGAADAVAALAVGAGKGGRSGAPSGRPRG